VECSTDDLSQQLIYWKEDKQGDDLKLASTGTLFAAIEDIATGKVSYKNSENIVERLARVGFRLLALLLPVLTDIPSLTSTSTTK
jgi:hypothetical protein